MKTSIVEILDRLSYKLQDKDKFKALLTAPVVKEFDISIKEIPKTPQEISEMMKEIENPESGKTAVKNSTIRKILLVLLGLYSVGGLSSIISILGYDVAYDIIHKSPNAASADLELLRKYFPKIRETIFNRAPKTKPDSNKLLAKTLETPEGRRIFIDPLRHQETIKKGPRIMRPGKGGPYERAKEKQQLQKAEDWS